MILGMLALALGGTGMFGCSSSVVVGGGGDEGSDDPGAGAGAGTGGSSGSTDPSGGTTSCETGTGLFALAPAEHGGSFITVHDGYVYWSTENAIHRAAQTGGSVEIIAAGLNLPMGLSVDDSGVYWVTHYDDDLYRADLEGGPMEVMATVAGIGGAFSMVRTDEHHVYFQGSCPDVYRFSKSDATLELVASNPQGCVGGFAIDDDAIFYVHLEGDAGAIRRVPKDGGAPTVLSEAQVALAGGYSGAAPGITVDDAYVYWMSGSLDGFIARVPKTGGDTDIVATGVTQGQDVIVDSAQLYWSEHNQVHKADADGGSPVTVAAWSGVDELHAGIGPMGLAINGDRLFFTNYITTAPVHGVCK